MKAVKTINNLLNEATGSNSRFVLFIRQDMLDKCSGLDGNQNKTIQDYSINLIEGENKQKKYLIDIIERRLAFGLKEMQNLRGKNYYLKSPYYKEILKNSKILKKDIYQDVISGDSAPQRLQFLQQIDINISKYLDSRLFNSTLLRPRDIIKFFQFLIKNDETGDYNSFMQQYSEHFAGEFEDELIPVLRPKGGKELAFASLKNVLQLSGKRETIFAISDYINVFKDNGGHEIQAKEVLKILYEYSVIGNIDRTRQYKYFAYKEKNGMLNLSLDCCLHNGLFCAFGLKASDIKY